MLFRSQEHPKYEELCRRFLADSEDFARDNIAAASIERHFVNEDLEQCLEEIKDYIRGQSNGD